jgi:hypothetical protein
MRFAGNTAPARGDGASFTGHSGSATTLALAAESFVVRGVRFTDGAAFLGLVDVFDVELVAFDDPAGATGFVESAADEVRAGSCAWTCAA